MLNLNDDMDDIIRQAADDYPLKIDGSDWDKVLSGLQTAMPAAPANNKKYWWLLLLLLPLASALLLVNKPGESPKVIAHKTTTIKADNAAKGRTKMSEPINAKKEASEKNITTDTDVLLPVNLTNKQKESSLRQNNQPAVKTTVTAAKNKAFIISSNTPLANKYIIERKDLINKNNTIIPVIKSVTDSTKDYLNSANENKDGFVLEDKTAINNTKQTGIATAPAAALKTTNEKVVATLQKDSTAATKAAKSIKHTTAVKSKGLYIGLSGSLDASTVKLHAVKKAGFSASFIAGYRINNNWSVESGLMWDKKNYYSPGKYFDKTKTGLSADYNIHYLNGYCKMFEIPLNVKYDFNSKKQSGFYVMAGLSSYIMKKEYYNYYTTHFSEPSVPGYYGDRNYKNSTTNLFSVVNINGGYQFIFKNNNSLRIEPYFKIPLSGLGIGKLPFASTGISAAYTLPLHTNH